MVSGSRILRTLFVLVFLGSTVRADDGTHVQWGSLLKQSSLFLGVEHGFRLATEPATREGSRGSFFRGYVDSIRNLRGWGDGDEFYVNYVGHPLHGAVAGNIWLQNDPEYRGTPFSNDRHYWRGRFRAMAFSWLYSTQFEIGPISEASIGKIQSRMPQVGFVDHVVTPVLGTGWLIAEDWLDKKIIVPFENRFENRWARLFLRGGLNPSRSMANLIAGKVPWHRYTRGGVSSPIFELPPLVREREDTPAPLRYSVTIPASIWQFGNHVCVGGSAVTTYRMSHSWELAGEVGGCKMLGLGRGYSGDSLSYMAGPQWTANPDGRFRTRMNFLIGGHKVTEEDVTASNSFAMAMGIGMDLGLNRVVSLRLANLQYMHSRFGDPRLAEYRNGVRLSTGVVFQLGDW